MSLTLLRNAEQVRTDPLHGANDAIVKFLTGYTGTGEWFPGSVNDTNEEFLTGVIDNGKLIECMVAAFLWKKN